MARRAWIAFAWWTAIPTQIAARVQARSGLTRASHTGVLWRHRPRGKPGSHTADDVIINDCATSPAQLLRAQARKLGTIAGSRWRR